MDADTNTKFSMAIRGFFLVPFATIAFFVSLFFWTSPQVSAEEVKLAPLNDMMVDQFYDTVRTNYKNLKTDAAYSELQEIINMPKGFVPEQTPRLFRCTYSKYVVLAFYCDNQERVMSVLITTDGRKSGPYATAYGSQCLLDVLQTLGLTKEEMKLLLKNSSERSTSIWCEKSKRMVYLEARNIDIEQKIAAVTILAENQSMQNL